MPSNEDPVQPVINKQTKQIFKYKFYYILFSTIWLDVSLRVYTPVVAEDCVLLTGMGTRGFISTILSKCTYLEWVLLVTHYPCMLLTLKSS